MYDDLKNKSDIDKFWGVFKKHDHLFEQILCSKFGWIWSSGSKSL